MADDGVAGQAIETFAHFYRQVEEGASGLIHEGDIEPVPRLPSLDELDQPSAADAAAAAAETVVLKLNGGLGTSMGMERAKSLLVAKDGTTFLDIMIRQVLRDRERYGARLPLIFMNSFRTRDDVAEVLAGYPELAVGQLPVDFLQNREPKLDEQALEPISWPDDPELEWCPPGHGDLYPALLASGLLDRLLADGYRYLFCSNSDNLGATLEPRIPLWMKANEVPFLVESCRRTPADRKGGHLAIRRSDGRLILRETAQTSPEDLESLMDLSRHRYCNSNNIWIDLGRLRTVLDEADGVLDLPVIRNVKTVDPRRPDTPKVVQIESAMGAAVQCFDGARSLVVGRARFAPVKTTNDLLVLRSDAYRLTPEFRIELAPERAGGEAPYVDLDPRYYKLIDGFDERFPDGPVSLVGCDRFVVEGDVRFGAGVVVRGSVTVGQGDGRLEIEPGSRLE